MCHGIRAMWLRCVRVSGETTFVNCHNNVLRFANIAGCWTHYCTPSESVACASKGATLAERQGRQHEQSIH